MSLIILKVVEGSNGMKMSFWNVILTQQNGMILLVVVVVGSWVNIIHDVHLVWGEFVTNTSQPIKGLASKCVWLYMEECQIILFVPVVVGWWVNIICVIIFCEVNLLLTHKPTEKRFDIRYMGARERVSLLEYRLLFLWNKELIFQYGSKSQKMRWND